MSPRRSQQLLWPGSAYRRTSLASPSLTLIPLVQEDPYDQNPFPPIDPPHRYRVSRKAIILSAVAGVLLVLITVFIALFTSFVQGKEADAAASSSAAASASASS
ncbi:hypothetical protein FA95DRAFT_1676572 [Auriscalpium vulgare]|uniref:Uncharacterized protein n=1 Tax=Auriscalpium vulgare TaxID=40419 RepID=A0ACB8S3P8_9AGAM|nr:hypothetical protein FA95DRAFT_1676572 [Auriscalpium vulgare]